MSRVTFKEWHVYEKWYISCKKNTKEKIKEQEEDKMKATKLIREIKKFKYIGETVGGAYERGLEHLRDFEEMKLDSHILKHYVGWES